MEVYIWFRAEAHDRVARQQIPHIFRAVRLNDAVRLQPPYETNLDKLLCDIAPIRLRNIPSLSRSSSPFIFLKTISSDTGDLQAGLRGLKKATLEPLHREELVDAKSKEAAA